MRCPDTEGAAAENQSPEDALIPRTRMAAGPIPDDGGAFTFRLCALNADGDCGPWSAESNAVTLD